MLNTPASTTHRRFAARTVRPTVCLAAFALAGAMMFVHTTGCDDEAIGEHDLLAAETAGGDGLDHSQSVTQAAGTEDETTLAPPNALRATLSNGDVVEVDLDESDEVDLDRLMTGEADPEFSAINWGMSLSLGEGQAKSFIFTASAGKPYFVTAIPSSGDPDIRLYKKVNNTWVKFDGSAHAAMRVDRRMIKMSGTTEIKMEFYGYTQSDLTASLTWETGGKLDLDVPYLNQNDIPDIGFAACSSASAAMVLATHGRTKVGKNDMISTANQIFIATADKNVGLNGRPYLKNNLENVWGMDSVYFDESHWPQLYAKIQQEIRAGRPMILGSKSMSSAGHYIVVRGFIGNDYNTAKLIVNDSNGAWTGYNSWPNKYGNAAGVEYNYKQITSFPTDGVFVIVPDL